MPYGEHKYRGLGYYWRTAVSGILCMGLSSVLTYPLDLIHTRNTTDLTKKGQPRLYKTTFDCFNRTHIDETMKGLYKGLGVTMFAGALRGGLTLPLYDMCRHKKLQTDDSFLGKFWTKLGPSVTTSLAISLLLYPLDTVKRCMQLNGGRGQLSNYKSYADCFKKLSASQGIAGFYRGAHLFFLKELI